MKKTILVCSLGCGTTAELEKSPKAWDGWQISPAEVCPKCIKKELDARAPATAKSPNVHMVAMGLGS